MLNVISERVQIVTVLGPSFEKYQSLYDEYGSSMDCTCSEIAIPYGAIVAVSPLLHPVCSSDFITNEWLWGLSFTSAASHPTDWFLKSASQFGLLAKLCNLTRSTVDDMLYQLKLRKVITSKLMSENEFYERLNVTIDATIQSTELHYRVMIETLKTLIQADQPFMIPDDQGSALSTNAKAVIKLVKNEYNNAVVPSVSYKLGHLKLMLFIACTLRLNYYWLVYLRFHHLGCIIHNLW